MPNFAPGTHAADAKIESWIAGVAQSQYYSRPADEKYSDLDTLRQVCAADKAACRTARVPAGSLKITPHGNTVAITGQNGIPAIPTNYAFRQLCSLVGAPSTYLPTLPPQLASDCLAHSFGKMEEKPKGILKTTFHIATHLAGLVEDLLDVSRIEQGWMKMSLERVGHHGRPRRHHRRVPACRPDRRGRLEPGGQRAGEPAGGGPGGTHRHRPPDLCVRRSGRYRRQGRRRPVEHAAGACRRSPAAGLHDHRLAAQPGAAKRP